MPLKTKTARVIELDETGRLVMFKLPFAALYYDMFCVRLRDQDRIDDCMDHLIEESYSMSDN